MGGASADVPRRAVADGDEHGGLAIPGGDPLRHEARAGGDVAAARRRCCRRPPPS